MFPNQRWAFRAVRQNHRRRTRLYYLIFPVPNHHELYYEEVWTNHNTGLVGHLQDWQIQTLPMHCSVDWFTYYLAINDGWDNANASKVALRIVMRRRRRSCLLMIWLSLQSPLANVHLSVLKTSCILAVTYHTRLTLMLTYVQDWAKLYHYFNDSTQ